MLKPEVWIAACKFPVSGIPITPIFKLLCIGCVEKRLGRILGPSDFTLCRLNLDPSESRSVRLKDRMRGLTMRIPDEFICLYSESQASVEPLRLADLEGIRRLK